VTTKTPDPITLDRIYLLPNQISTLPRYNVRPFSSTSEASAGEDRRVEELALSLETVGQLDAVILTPEHVLIAGHRRRRAAIILNERRSARGQSLFQLRCVIDSSGGDLRRKGIISNLHRRESSPMDMAYLIAQIRKDNNWVGWKGAKSVGEYLGIDPATVHSFEFFLRAEKELQNKIHDGTISAQSARDLMKELATPRERQEAIERAAEIQKEDYLEKQLDRYHRGKQTRAQTTAAIQDSGTNQRVEHPAVIKAIRERHTVTTTKHASTKKLCLSRAEILEALAQLDSDAYSETARSFARYLVRQFAQGMGTVEELRAKFMAVGPDEHTSAVLPSRREPGSHRDQMSSVAS
jgi:ParB-like chromosome segregation protein Spo0J